MSNDELALYLGKRILSDAARLMMFMPECYSKIPLSWCGSEFEIRLHLKGVTDGKEDDGKGTVTA